MFAAATAGRAHAQDRGELGLEADLRDLRELGLLAAALPMADGGAGLAHAAAGVAPALQLLAAIGRANLSLARLYEGHLNAIKLITLYGTDQQRRDCRDLVLAGAMYGVWGADGPQPARLVGTAARARLTGGKRFASGAGTLARALVPVTDPDGGQQLLILDVSDRRRVDLASWTANGMRASQSGQFDLTGIAVQPAMRLGRPGDFGREPWFIGGIWRCSAAQLGAIEQIVETTRQHLAAAGRLDDPFQRQRLGQAIMAAHGARLWVQDAAHRVERGLAVTEAVAAAGLARLAVEAAGLQVISLAQRSIGLAGMAAEHPAEQLCRDLAVYLRQAAPDVLLQNATRQLLSLDRPLPGFAQQDDPAHEGAWAAE